MFGGNEQPELIITGPAPVGDIPPDNAAYFELLQLQLEAQAEDKTFYLH